MKIYNLKPILIVLVLISSQIYAQVIDLKKQDWALVNASSTITLSNSNPSDVHLSLFEAGIINDPFYGNNEDSIKWVGVQDWIYSSNIIIDSMMMNKKSAKIYFDGLDTYAEVYINDSLILKADNMFIGWEVDIKNFLHHDKNSIKIKFTNPKKINKQKANSFEYRLPDERAFSRKAAYQFGWDWGPEIITMGIWKDAKIVFEDEPKIIDLFIKQKSISTKVAVVEVNVEINSIDFDSIDLNLFSNEILKIEKTVALTKGVNNFSFPVEINKPKLWWPNGLGEQNIYKFKAVISNKDEIKDIKIAKTGLRNAEVIQETDSIGTSFFFRINGIDVFAKGANYIPQDNFLSRVKYSDYEKVINTAVESNMNMLRVWGGGIYENDEFYDLCDEKGIMVWQDFMFAGNMYPNDSGFLQSIKTESTQNVKRLRNHPSIVLWCGNNEISEAWHNWGWQQSYSWTEQDSTELWENYITIFEEILPSIISEYSPGSFYWPSSPSNGWGREKAYLKGDVHYWGVWWGKEPFKKYNEKVGRFMSEYGFQGMPDMKTIESFAETEDMHFNSDVMKSHQKHPFGWENIQEYLARDYPDPENFDQLVYLSQLMQAEGIKIAIEAHRRAKPYCMGTLYWQLNDCWPVTSWSSVDYYGRWKALQYFVKKAYEKYLISFEQNNQDLQVYFISDDNSPLKAGLKWKIIDFDGNTILRGNQSISIDQNSSTIAKVFSKEVVESWRSLNDKILVVEVFSNNKKIASATKIFINAKNLKLSTENIEYELSVNKGSYLLRIKTESFVKGLQISCLEDGFFSDNYFDLVPGEIKEISFKTKSVTINKDSFKFTYLK